MQKCYVLGSNSFIGRNVIDNLSQAYQVIPLSRRLFDITNSLSYGNFDFSNSILIDCIVAVDRGSEIINTNVKGFEQYILFLKKNAKNIQYLYFSTTSTQIVSQRQNNTYVNSKYLAENILKANIENHKIVRLTFPFGIAEKANRLFSRLIGQVHRNEHIEIKNITMNLTPVEYLNSSLINLLNDNSNEIDFTFEGKVFKLIDIMKYIASQLNYANVEYLEEQEIHLEVVNKCIGKIEDIKQYIDAYLEVPSTQYLTLK